MATCKDCNLAKAIEDFNVDKKNNTPYPNCKDCFHKASVQFWSIAQFKFCNACNNAKPIREFNSYMGVPNMHCRECFEKRRCAEMTARRMAAMRKKKEEEEAKLENGEVIGKEIVEEVNPKKRKL